MTRVFLVDGHHIVRRGIADLIGAEPDLELVGEAETVSRAIEDILRLRPDVVVLEIRLPDGDGIALCRELQNHGLGAQLLILTAFIDEKSMLNAIRAGVSGYVIKDIGTVELVDAIREVGSGKSLLDNRAAAALMSKLRADGAARRGPFAHLTAQERTLLELLGEGLSNRQIAERMSLAEKTIRNYVSRLLTKLGVERRSQAAVLALELRPSSSVR
ncbi:response regulator [Nocardia brasiliensis]|uniref:response regulator transcription factor n=1 Tax=Nocardia brasiliensis TaxID=37326 RepID=UPI0024589DCA|nr:response regulator transcription factor [Nocardia brasiliensis]